MRAVLLATLVLAGCREEPQQALGTLEYDRITLPAPAAERIVSLDVREGQRVEAGTRLMSLERTRSEAQTSAALSEVQRARELLAELNAGARIEDVDQARANLAAAQAQAADARAFSARVIALGRRKLVAAVEVDRARVASNSADAQVRSAQAALAKLRNGTRPEQIAQGEAALGAAQAQLRALEVTLGKLDIIAPRPGLIDSLPYKAGDQAPVGAPLAVMLVGAAPYARIYVPAPIRANVRVGDAAAIHVHGHDRAFPGRVRAIRSEPNFTPYYALIGEDAARLSYLAEIELEESASGLPAGMPVRVVFAESGKRE